MDNFTGIKVWNGLTYRTGTGTGTAGKTGIQVLATGLSDYIGAEAWIHLMCFLRHTITTTSSYTFAVHVQEAIQTQEQKQHLSATGGRRPLDRRGTIIRKFAFKDGNLLRFSDFVNGGL